MCPAGLQGAVPPSPLVNAGHRRWLVCWTLFSVTDTTNSQAQPHFKATGRVRGELLRVNTGNWRTFPAQIQGLRQIQFFHNKNRTPNCCIWVNKINNNILLLHKRKKQNNSGKSGARKSFCISEVPPLKYPYPGLSLHKISLSLDEPGIKYQLIAEGEKVVRQQ